MHRGDVHHWVLSVKWSLPSNPQSKNTTTCVKMCVNGSLQVPRSAPSGTQKAHENILSGLRKF